MPDRLELVASIKNNVSPGLKRISGDMAGVKPSAGMKQTETWFGRLSSASDTATKSVRPLVGGLNMVGAGGLAAGLSIAGLARQFVDLAKALPALQELSRQTGLSTTEIERLKAAASNLGVDPAKMQASLGSFSRMMVDFHRRHGDLYEEMANHGAAGLAEKIRQEDPAAAYRDMLKWLDAIPAAQKAAGKSAADAAQIQRHWAGEAFGDEDMAQLLSKGMTAFSDAYAQASRDVHEITAEAIKAAEAFDRSIASFERTWKDFETTVGPTVFDNLRHATDAFREVFDEIKGATTFFDKVKDHPAQAAAEAAEAAESAIDRQAAENKKHPDGIVVDVPGLLSKGIHALTDTAPERPAQRVPIPRVFHPDHDDRLSRARSSDAPGVASKVFHFFTDPGVRPSPNAPLVPVPTAFRVPSRYDAESRARAGGDGQDHSLDGFVMGALDKPVLHLAGTLKTASAAIGDGLRTAAFHPAGGPGLGAALDPQAIVAAGTKEGVLSAFREWAGMQDLNGKSGIMPASFGGGVGGSSPSAAGRAPSLRFGRQHSSAPYTDGGATPTGAHDPLKDLIAAHETGGTGAAGYDTVFGHAERGGPLAPPKPLTQMTIAEVLAYQRAMKPRAGSAAFPVGRAQWTESTLRGLTRAMDPSTVFSPDVQEKLFDRSIAGRMGQGSGGFRSEWDSLRAVPDGEIDRALDGHREALRSAPAKLADAIKAGSDGIAGHVRGNLKIGDETYAYGSGGVRGAAHVPFGDYPIRPDSGNPWGQTHNAMDVNGDGSIWDASLGRMRTGIEMHVAHSANMVTEGCLSFLKDQYPQLKSRVKDMIAKTGHAYLHVDENGASITPFSKVQDKPRPEIAPMPAIAPEPPRQEAPQARRDDDESHLHVHLHQDGRVRAVRTASPGVKLHLDTGRTFTQFA